MLDNNLPDPDAAYAPIRSELARLFVLHKADLGMADVPDDQIVANLNRIAEIVMAKTNAVLASDDAAKTEEWLVRHRWWVEAGIRLYCGLPAVRLDG